MSETEKVAVVLPPRTVEDFASRLLESAGAAPDNARMLVVPEGCAHGFQVLEPERELLYLHTALYAPEAESGVSCNDPRLGIAWPLPVEGLSRRVLGFAPIALNSPRAKAGFNKLEASIAPSAAPAPTIV